MFKRFIRFSEPNSMFAEKANTIREKFSGKIRDISISLSQSLLVDYFIHNRVHGMRHIALAVLALMILASVAVTATVSPIVSAEKEKYSFVLEASGEAYDERHKSRTVDLSISGSVKVKFGSGPNRKYLWEFKVASGTVEVQGYGTFSVVGGEGKLIQEYGNDVIIVSRIIFNIRITPPYGGPSRIWHMEGTTGEYSAGPPKEIPNVSLSSKLVELPTRPPTKLRNLVLTGKITLSDS